MSDAAAFQPIDARTVANVLLGLARRDGERLDLVRTMHLVYYAHGWHLAFTGRPLLDEEIQARDQGPIVSSLYEEGRRIGVNPIPDRFLFPDEDGRIVTAFAAAEAALERLVARVWTVYGPHTDYSLAQSVGGSGTPWKMTWLANMMGLRQVAIRNADIETYFIAQRHHNEFEYGESGIASIRYEHPE